MEFGSSIFRFQLVVAPKGAVVVLPKYGMFLHIFFLSTQVLNYIWEVPRRFSRIYVVKYYHYNSSVILIPEQGQIVLFDPERRRISGNLNFSHDDCPAVYLDIFVEGMLAVVSCSKTYARLYKLLERKNKGYFIITFLFIRTLLYETYRRIVLTDTADVVAWAYH